MLGCFGARNNRGSICRSTLTPPVQLPALPHASLWTPSLLHPFPGLREFGEYTPVLSDFARSCRIQEHTPSEGSSCFRGCVLAFWAMREQILGPVQPLSHFGCFVRGSDLGAASSEAYVRLFGMPLNLALSALPMQGTLPYSIGKNPPGYSGCSRRPTMGGCPLRFPGLPVFRFSPVPS